MSRRALVVRLDNAGAVLRAGPAVRAVAATARHVTMLAGPHGAEAARLLPRGDDVGVWRAPWLPDGGPVDAASVDGLVVDLRRLELDDALVLTSFHQSPLPMALLLRLAGVRRIAA